MNDGSKNSSSDGKTTAVNRKQSSKNTGNNNNNNNHKTKKDGGNGVIKKKELMGAPPDGGWGWVVVFASFSISVLVDGICFSFGIFIDTFTEEFETSKAVTSWIGSILNGTYLSVGPIVSVLVNIYGCRKVTTSGGILAFIAFFVSTYSSDIGVLIFTYGFLGGLGIGLMYLPAIVMVGYYFERRRALATGIACCGSGIGAFVMAPVNEYLLQEYGWRGATWILSALSFHAVLFAMFYRPLPPAQIDVDEDQVEKGEPEKLLPAEGEGETVELLAQDTENSTDVKSMKPVIPEITVEDVEETGKTTLISDDLKNQIFETLKVDIGLEPVHRARSMTLTVAEPPRTKKSEDNVKTATARLAFSQDLSLHHRTRPKGDHSEGSHPHSLAPLQRKDIFYSGSLWHLREFQELGSTDRFRREMIGSSASIDTVPQSSVKQFIQSFVSIFDLSLLSSPTFLIYGLSCFLCMAGFFVPFIYMPTHAVDMGIDSQAAAFLISIIGITNTVGRVLVGFVSDQPWADCLLINNVALMIGGVSTCFVPFYPEYYVLGIYAAVFGTSIAIFVSLRSIIMVELMGLEKLTTAFGFVIMCQGISSLVGAPIAGSISEGTGNYNAAFYIAGSLLAISGVICLPLRRIAEWESKREGSVAIPQRSNSMQKNGSLVKKAPLDKNNKANNEQELQPMV